MVILLTFICVLIGKAFIFGKMNEKEWKGMIPFYNDFIIYKNLWSTEMFILKTVFEVLVFSLTVAATILVKVSGFEILSLEFLIAAFFLLIIHFVISILMAHKLSKAFGHDVGFTCGLILLEPVFYLVLGFNKDQYLNKEI